jgi:recombination protein RecT
MTTISQAIEKQDAGPGSLVARYKTDFQQVLPSHIPSQTFVRLAQGVLRKDEKLAAAATANPGSFLAALLECARLGHEPGTEAYALTWFRNNKTGVPEIVGIEQYQGEIERMYRAGGVLAVRCEIVRQNDTFRWSPTTMRLPLHEFDALADDTERGPLRGVYAYAEMVGGALSQPVVMGKGEVMKHKAVAKSEKFWTGPWEPSMWKKTAVHELEKWVPTSSEYRREQLRDAVAIQRSLDQPHQPVPAGTPIHSLRPADVPADVLDGEVVDDQPAGEQIDESSGHDRARDERRMFALLGELGMADKDGGRDDRLAIYSAIARRPIGSTKDLTDDEVELAVNHLDGIRRIGDEEDWAGEVGALIVDGTRTRTAGAP